MKTKRYVPADDRLAKMAHLLQQLIREGRTIEMRNKNGRWVKRMIVVVGLLAFLAWQSWQVNAQSPHSITVAWTPGPAVSGATVTGFNVLRGTITGGPYTSIATTGPNITTHSDINGVGGTRYFYVIRAVAGTFESANSNEASAIFLANPAAPAGVTAVAQ